MKDISSWALNTAALRGASYADARIADDRHRALSTKNGKVGSASVSESFGFGVRVIADGAGDSPPWTILAGRPSKPLRGAPSKSPKLLRE
jgi:TldD protein